MGGQILSEHGSLRHTVGAGCAVCRGCRGMGKVGNDLEKSIHKMFSVLLPHRLCSLPGMVTTGSVLTCCVAVCLRFERNILGYLGLEVLWLKLSLHPPLELP